MREDTINVRMRGLWSIELVEPCVVQRWVLATVGGEPWQRYVNWRQELQLGSGERTIETGCGYGKFSMALGLNGARVTLLDYNEEAVRVAKHAHASVGLEPEVVAADLVDLPDELRGAFDVVCSFGTLEHFRGEWRQSALQACADLLRPAGMLFFTVPNRYGIFYRVVFGLRRCAGRVHGDFYERPYSFRELIRGARKAGIEPLEVQGLGTLRDDFRYWIGGNLRGLLRKFLRRPTPPALPPPALLSKEDLVARVKKPTVELRRNPVARRFTADILFVGRKLDDSN